MDPVEPNNKKTIAIIAVAVFIVFVLVAVALKQGLFQKKGSLPGDTAVGEAPETYSPEVPKNVELTPPTVEGLVNPTAQSGPKIRVFEVRVSKSGYDPSEVVVNFGDTVGITVVAVDGDYDFDLPAIGGYQFVKRGEKRQIGFQALKAGTFVFWCRDHCPGGDKISGKFIVKE